MQDYSKNSVLHFSYLVEATHRKVQITDDHFVQISQMQLFHTSVEK